MAHVRMCLDICHLQLIMIDRHLSAKSQANCSRDNDNLAMESIAPQRDRQLIIDVICKWHDAAASVMRITRRVLLAKRWWQQLPLSARPGPVATRGEWSWHNPMCKPSGLPNRVAFAFGGEAQRVFCPRTIAAHFPFGQIGPQIYKYICMFCVLGQPLCVPLTKYC